MSKHNQPLIRSLIVIPLLLFIWSIAITYLYLSLEPYLHLLGIGLNVIIILVSLWRPYRYAAWTSSLISILIYTVTASFLQDTPFHLSITCAISAIVFLITMFLGMVYRKQADHLIAQHEQQKNVIDSLTVYDARTKLMKMGFAKRALTTEILRSHRYHGELSLILFASQKDVSISQKKSLKDEKMLAEILLDVVRPDIDIPFIGQRIGLILPERDLAFSQAFAYKIIPIMQNKINARVSAGLSNFPQDADTAQDMLNQAEEALQVALHTGLNLFMYRSLLLEKKREEYKLSSLTEDKQAITKPVLVTIKRSPNQDYEKILSNIHLAEDEWIMWVYGFGNIEELAKLANNPLSAQHIVLQEFLYVQSNYLVIKIKTTLHNLVEHKNPFTGWVIKKANPRIHYLVISRDK